MYCVIAILNVCRLWRTFDEVHFGQRVCQIGVKKVSSGPFNSSEWLASNFSLHYHPWFTQWSHKNTGNDHQLKKLSIVNKFSLSASFEIYRGTVWRICTRMLRCKQFILVLVLDVHSRLKLKIKKTRLTKHIYSKTLNIIYFFAHLM